VIAAIMEREPEPLKTTPPLDRVIRKCLAKDPDERFQSARDLKTALLWATEGAAAAVPAATSRGRLPWIAAVVLGLIAVGISTLHFNEKPAPETRVDIVTPPTDSPGSFALSPDGRKIAFAASGDGAQRLWVRSLDSTSAQARREPKAPSIPSGRPTAARSASSRTIN
jgi:hypothetical protein